MPGFFQLRRFRTRLLLIVLGLLSAALCATYFLVAQANADSARNHIEQNLATSVRVFWRSVDLRKESLALSAQVLSADWPFRTLYLQDTLDRRTLRSTLDSYAERLNVRVIAAFTPEGEMLATTADNLTDEHCGPFRHLIRKADTETLDQASDFAYLREQLHVLIVVPLYAPRPNIIGWIGVAFPIDDQFARDLKTTTQAEVSFVSGRQEAQQRVLATTLSAAQAGEVARHHPTVRDNATHTLMVDLDGEPYVSLFSPLGLLGDEPARIVLQRSFALEMAPARELQNVILLISLAALAAASVIAVAVARNISQPIQQLAWVTRLVAKGDYTQRIDLKRADELGQLARDFNHMTAGLAERDRVRDLLGKVVSPEIAAQLLQSDLQLGGEEREVTILFSDIRDFTGLSEKLPPSELLALLNRYLDRMSGIVEKHGGVIDKYIGDAIMALFGAPVAASDSAAQALAAAREMNDALMELNRELLAEGKSPLEIGIGINTARVVAGNMGSKTRLNYTVIGDGVNLAARLETLTKNPEYRCAAIVSEATARAAGEEKTLRPLGPVTVKGKAEAVRIFALDLAGRPWPERSAQPN